MSLRWASRRSWSTRSSQIVRDINQQGTTILLVEQNALKALEIAHTGYVLQTGEIVLQDTAASLRSNETVQRAYLGVD